MTGRGQGVDEVQMDKAPAKEVGGGVVTPVVPSHAPAEVTRGQNPPP